MIEGSFRCGASLTHAGELRRELSEAEVLGLVGDQVKRGGVPEAGGAAVAEQHFVSVGQREEGTKAVANFGDLVAHR